MPTLDDLMRWMKTLSDEDRSMAQALASYARREGRAEATPRYVLDVD